MSELEQAFNFKELGEEGLWANIEYFLKRVIPVAEEGDKKEIPPCIRSPFRNQNPLPKTELLWSGLLCRTRPARTQASCLTW